jgi:hypothetical protein
MLKLGTGPKERQSLVLTLQPQAQLKAYLCLASFIKESHGEEELGPTIAKEGSAVEPAILAELKECRDEWALHRYLYILKLMAANHYYDFSKDQDALRTIEEVVGRMQDKEQPHWMSNYMTPEDRKWYKAQLKGGPLEGWSYDGPEKPPTWQDWLDSLKSGQEKSCQGQGVK